MSGLGKNGWGQATTTMTEAAWLGRGKENLKERMRSASGVLGQSGIPFDSELSFECPALLA